jgi:hypothetical protein
VIKCTRIGWVRHIEAECTYDFDAKDKRNKTHGGLDVGERIIRLILKEIVWNAMD